jgi:hypothetical protein
LLAQAQGTMLTNRAITGSQVCDVAIQQVFPNDNPSQSFGPINQLLIGTNDANTKGSVAGYDTAVFNKCH